MKPRVFLETRLEAVAFFVLGVYGLWDESRQTRRKSGPACQGEADYV